MGVHLQVSAVTTFLSFCVFLEFLIVECAFINYSGCVQCLCTVLGVPYEIWLTHHNVDNEKSVLQSENREFWAKGNPLTFPFAVANNLC
jgi:hypothetical protein